MDGWLGKKQYSSVAAVWLDGWMDGWLNTSSVAGASLDGWMIGWFGGWCMARWMDGWLAKTIQLGCFPMAHALMDVCMAGIKHSAALLIWEHTYLDG